MPFIINNTNKDIVVNLPMFKVTVKSNSHSIISVNHKNSLSNILSNLGLIISDEMLETVFNKDNESSEEVKLTEIVEKPVKIEYTIESLNNLKVWELKEICKSTGEVSQNGYKQELIDNLINWYNSKKDSTNAS